MSYDPCGTQRLDGDEILRRLAKYLEVNVEDLKAVLTNKHTTKRLVPNQDVSVSCVHNSQCDICGAPGATETVEMNGGELWTVCASHVKKS